MTDAYQDLIEFLEFSETIEAVVFGAWGWDGYGEPDPSPVPPDKRGVLLTEDEAAPLMKGWKLNGGFGAPKCYAMYVWTSDRVIWVTQYDGATGLDSAPRNPTAVMPDMPGRVRAQGVHMKESNIQARIMIALSEAGCTVWRNETAGAWVGAFKGRNAAGYVMLDKARQLKAGLCTGSSDVIGIAPDGRFLAVEVKADRGRVSDDQKGFIEAVKRGGGIAGVARSVEDALALLEDGNDAG